MEAWAPLSPLLASCLCLWAATPSDLSLCHQLQVGRKEKKKLALVY